MQVAPEPSTVEMLRHLIITSPSVRKTTPQTENSSLLKRTQAEFFLQLNTVALRNVCGCTVSVLTNMQIGLWEIFTNMFINQMHFILFSATNPFVKNTYRRCNFLRETYSLIK